MPRQEAQAVFSLGVIMAFRMLGLFMILPIFSIAAIHLQGATDTLIGLALGIYGLTQACLQIPFGRLSDRIGRKPIIVLGLILFALGSVVCALSHSIYGIIAGRALQGSGAIGSTCLALVADLTRDQHRSKAMAMVGMSIGLSFLIAIVLGPLIFAHYNLSGVFWFTACLALLAIALLLLTIPKPPTLERMATPGKRYHRVFTHPQLLRLDLAIFIQHAVMTVMFLALPLILNNRLQLSLHQQTGFYCIILILAFIGMLPFVIIAEKKRVLKGTLLGAIGLLLLSQILMPTLPPSVLGTGFILLLFFTAFTLLESLLPSLVSKIAPINLKGTAMGIYSTCQFLGIFIGGSVGGLLLMHFGLQSLFFFNALLIVVWLAATVSMRQPAYLSTLIFPWPDTHATLEQISQHLHKIKGVADIALATGEKLIYVKADKKKIDENELRNALEPVTLNKLI